MAEKIKSDPAGDALRFTFEVVDKASANLKNIEKSFAKTVKDLATAEERLKAHVTQLQTHTVKAAAALGNLSKSYTDHARDVVAATAKVAAVHESPEDVIRGMRAELAVMAKKAAALHEEEKALEKVQAARTKATAAETAAIASGGRFQTIVTNLAKGFTSRFGGGGASRFGGGGAAGITQVGSRLSDLGAAGIGAVTGFVGKQTLEFDDDMTNIRRNIGQTNAEFVAYENTVLDVGLKHHVLRKDMVDIAGVLSKVGRTAFDISGAEGLGAVADSFETYTKAAGFSEEQTKELLATNLHFFGESAVGLQVNADEWSKINKMTTLTHDEMYGLIDATKIAVGLSQQQGANVTTIQKGLALGVDYWKRMGASSEDALNTLNRFSDPLNHMLEVAKAAQIMPGYTVARVAREAAMGTFPLDEFRMREAFAVESDVNRAGGPGFGTSLVAKTGMYGTDATAIRELTLEAEKNRKHAAELREKDKEKYKGSDIDVLMTEIRERRAAGPTAEQAAVTLGAGEKLEKSLDELNTAIVKNMLPAAHALSSAIDDLAKRMSGILPKLTFIGTALGVFGGVLNAVTSVMKLVKGVRGAGGAASAAAEAAGGTEEFATLGAIAKGAGGTTLAGAATAAGVGLAGGVVANRIIAFKAEAMNAESDALDAESRRMENDEKIRRSFKRKGINLQGDVAKALHEYNVNKRAATPAATGTVAGGIAGDISYSGPSILNDPKVAPYRQAIIDAAAKYGLDPEVQARQIMQESSFNPSAKGGDYATTGSVGLAQFTRKTGRQYGLMSESDQMDPLKSIEANAHYMSDLRNQYGGSYQKALAAYNTGKGDATSAAGAKYIADVLGRHGRSPSEPLYTESPNLVSAVNRQTKAVEKLTDHLTKTDPNGAQRDRLANGG